MLVGARRLEFMLAYRVESTRIFSTKNVTAVSNWRQLRPRAPRKRKAQGLQTEKTIQNESTSSRKALEGSSQDEKNTKLKPPVRELKPRAPSKRNVNKGPNTLSSQGVKVLKDKSLSSIQALESNIGPAQHVVVREHKTVEPTTVELELASSAYHNETAAISERVQETNNVGTMHSGQAKDAPGERVRDTKMVSDSTDKAERKLVNYNKWKFGIASFLGCTPAEVTQRVTELGKAGFCNEHIDLLLRKLPPTLRISSKTVYQNVNTFIKWNVPWKQFVDTNPEILLFQPSQVETRLEYLTNIGISASCLDLRSLLILMHTDVTQATVDRINDCKELKIAAAELCNNLHLAISDLASLRHSDDVAKISHLLKEFGGIPNKKLLKYPYLTYKRLNDVLKVLSGKPLYLDNYQIQHVLIEFPKLLNDTAISLEELHRHLEDVHSLVPAPVIMQLIRKANGLRILFDSRTQLKKKVEFLERQGFSKPQIAKMMASMTYMFMEDLDSHTAPLMKHFMGLKKATPDVVMKMSGKGGSFYSRYFSKSPIFVSARLSAAEDHCPSLLDVTKLNELFGTRAAHFAKLCGITTEDLQNKYSHAVNLITSSGQPKEVIAPTESTDTTGVENSTDETNSDKDSAAKNTKH